MPFELPRRYPLLLPACGLAAGIYSAAAWGGFPLWCLALAGSSALFAAWRLAKLRPAAILILAFLFGSWRAAPFFPTARSAPLDFGPLEKRTVESVFRVEDYPRCAARHCGTRARLLAWGEGGRFQALPRTDFSLRVWRPDSQWIPGEVYRAELRFSAPRRFKNPHSFDYPEYLRRQGLAALASVRDLAPEQRIRAAPAWRARVAAFRHGRLLWLRENLPPGPGRALLQALLFGEKGGLGGEIETVFRRTGLTHVLVVSGLHFAFLFLCFQAPLSWLLSVSPRLSQGGGARMLAWVLAALPCLFYGLVVGLSPSVLRSLAALIVFAFAWMGGLRKDFLSVLLLIGIFLLLAAPLLLFSISFQLSFASVAALTLLARAWRPRSQGTAAFPGFWRAWVRRGGIAFGSTLGVTLALAPWLAGKFHEFSLVAAPANLLFVPLFSGALPLGLAASVLGTTGLSFATTLLHGLHAGAEGAYFVLQKIAAWPGSSLLFAPWTLFEWLAYLFFMSAIFRPRPRGKALLLSVLALISLGAGELRRSVGLAKGFLSLTMFDVGQGESLLLELPEGQALLLDGGGFPGSPFDVGRNVLAPELLARGRRRLEAMALSHADADHAKGLRFLVERLPPREFWLPHAMEGRPGFAALAESLRRRRVPLRRLSRGEKWSFGGAAFEVLWPPREAAGFSDNDLSLVLRVCHGDHCFLLTGDIESEAESGIRPQARPSSVLKVAHHGSKTSSSPEFMAAWRPRVALISAGSGNRYRLPHRQVLAELQSRGIEILRSDRDGQVQVRSDGRTLEWRRFRESPLPSRWFAIRAAVSGSGS